MIAVAEALQRIGVRFAVVGGMAVSFRTVERFTKDVDLAIAVENDAEAEKVVRAISESDY
ncbi:MAG: nucleotidyltransferase, partial [Pyrinomonadaceae bacterium]